MELQKNEDDSVLVERLDREIRRAGGYLLRAIEQKCESGHGWIVGFAGIATLPTTAIVLGIKVNDVFLVSKNGDDSYDVKVLASVTFSFDTLIFTKVPGEFIADGHRVYERETVEKEVDVSLLVKCQLDLQKEEESVVQSVEVISPEHIYVPRMTTSP